MPSITINGHSLEFIDTGEGFPVLLGHSYLWTHSMWQHQIDSLAAQGFRCIVPDLWGHGLSGANPDAVKSLDALTESMDMLVDSLGLDAYAIAGLSVGGMWGARLALRHTERVRGLMLLNTDLHEEPADKQALYLSMLDATEKAGCFPPPLADQVVPFFFAPETYQEQPSLVSDFRQSLLAIPAANIPTIVRLGRSIFTRESIMDRMASFTVPTLIISGESDKSRPPAESEAMAQAIPMAKLHIIPKAGHITAREQPEQTARIMLDFLAAIWRN